MLFFLCGEGGLEGVVGQEGAGAGALPKSLSCSVVCREYYLWWRAHSWGSAFNGISIRSV